MKNLVKKFLNDERGMAAITFALVFPLIMVIAFISIEVGNAQLNKNSLQSASDAATLAALNVVTNQGSFQSAASAAQQMFNANYNGNAQVSVTVTQGYLDTNTAVFYAGNSQLNSGCPSASKCVSAVQTHITGTIKTVTGSIPKGIPVDITSTAVPSNSGKALVNAAYPLAIDQCVMNNYWDSKRNSPVIDQAGNCKVIKFGYKSRDPDLKCDRTAQWTTMQSSGDSSIVKNQLTTGNSKELKSSDSVRLITGTSNYESSFTVGQEITVPVTEKTAEYSSKVIGFTTIRIQSVTPGTSDSGYITGCLENKSNPKMTRNDGGEKEYGTTGLGAKLVRDH